MKPDAACETAENARRWSEAQSKTVAFPRAPRLCDLRASGGITNWRRAAVGGAYAVAAALTIAACGGGYDSPGTPTNPGGTGGPIGATITIGADGRVSPADVTVAPGSRVTFTNSHNQPHDMSSDPHPDHTRCPEITVGSLQPNQSRTTQNLTVARRCGFHDHGQPSNTGLQGSITIQ